MAQPAASPADLHRSAVTLARAITIALPLETPFLTNTWDRDARGNFTRAVVEAVDGTLVGIDPLAYL